MAVGVSAHMHMTHVHGKATPAVLSETSKQ